MSDNLSTTYNNLALYRVDNSRETTDKIAQDLETALTALNRIAFPEEHTYGNSEFIAKEAIKKIVGFYE